MTAAPACIRTVGLVGAGAMGRGIAEVCLQAGFQVILRDVDGAAAQNAVTELQATCDRPDQVSMALADTDLTSAQIVIEAVPEQMDLKTRLLSTLETVLSDDTILASNSSSLSITQLSRALQKQDRFCGLHFCYPVQQRPLVEVIGADGSSPLTLNAAFAFAESLGMAPLIVEDSPGFLLNRLIVPYLNEALELLLDGADVGALDRAAAAFGMSRGPLALFDDFGVDVALAVGRSLYTAFPDRISPSEMLIAMYKSRRLGRKAGGGFYADQAAADAGIVDPDVIRLIQERRRTDQPLDEAQVARRLFLPMLLEATRTLQDGLVSDPQVIDDAIRDGLGTTSTYRGLFGWADEFGGNTLLEWLQPLRALGPRFEPTARLQQMVNDSVVLDAA